MSVLDNKNALHIGTTNPSERVSVTVPANLWSQISVNAPDEPSKQINVDLSSDLTQHFSVDLLGKASEYLRVVVSNQLSKRIAVNLSSTPPVVLEESVQKILYEVLKVIRINGIQADNNGNFVIDICSEDELNAALTLAMTSVELLGQAVEEQSTQIRMTAEKIESKADKLLVDAIRNVVDRHSTQITQTAEKLESKAEKSTIDALGIVLSQQATQITQTAEKLESKAEKSTVDALGNTLSQHATQITQTAEKLESKAEKSVVDALGQTVSRHESAITQTPEQIRMAVESVQIGGRNLLPDTKELESWRYSPDKTWRYGNESGFYRFQMTESGQTSDTWHMVATPATRLPDGWYGKQITLSAYIWSENWAAMDAGGNTPIHWAVCLNKGGIDRLNYGVKYPIKPDRVELGDGISSDVPLGNYKWVRVSMTWTLDEAGMPNGSGVFTDNTHVWVQFLLRRNGSYRVYAPKLEFGNKATDWSPAPEDTDVAIAELSAAITVQAGEITSNAQKIETVSQAAGNAQSSANAAQNTANAAQNAANSAQGTANGAVTRVTAAEQRISAVEGSIVSKVSKTEFDALGNTVSQMGTEIRQNEEEILLLAGKKSGGTQLLKNGGFYGGLSNWSKLEYNVNGEWRNLYVEAPTPDNQYRSQEAPNLILHAQYETGMFGAAQVVNGLRKNTQYTISGYVASHRCNRAGIEIRDTTASRWAMNPVFDVGWGGTNLSAYNRFEYTFDTGDYSDYQITLYSNNFQDNAYVWWAQIKLEEGNTATAWSPHPDDPASGVDAGGVVRVDQTGVHMSGGTIEMETSDGDEYIHIRNDGISASSLNAPDVTPRYSGFDTLYVNPNATSAQIAKGDTFRSLVDALAKLSGRWIDKNIVIHVTAGMTEYSTPTMMCVHGSNITIHGNGAKLVGGFGLYNGSANVTINNLNVDMTGSAGFNANNWTKLVINNCVITGTGSGYGVYSSHNAGVTVSACEIYDCNRSLYGIAGGEIDGYSCKGNCRVGANRSTLYLHDSMPCDVTTWATSLWAGQVLVSNISVDQGSKPTPIPTPTTVTYNYTRSDSYRGGWSYFDTDAPRQGFNGMDIYGTIWFDAAAIRSALSGKTIKQASLRLFMVKGVGRGRSVVVQLHGTNMGYDGRSGRPELTTSYGTIGTTEPDMNNEMTIPTAVIDDIVSGRIQALVLKSDDTVEYKDKFYSENYARFEGSTSNTTADNCPRLTVVYQ